MEKIYSYREEQINKVIKKRLLYPHKENIKIQLNYGTTKTNFLNISFNEICKIRDILDKKD